jgi:hypothetical protein
VDKACHCRSQPAKCQPTLTIRSLCSSCPAARTLFSLILWGSRQQIKRAVVRSQSKTAFQSAAEARRLSRSSAIVNVSSLKLVVSLAIYSLNHLKSKHLGLFCHP